MYLCTLLLVSAPIFNWNPSNLQPFMKVSSQRISGEHCTKSVLMQLYAWHTWPCLLFYRLFSMYIEDSEDQREKQMKSAANCTCTIFRIHFRHCIFRIHFRQCIKKTQGIMKEQNGGMSSRLDGGRRREMDKWSERNKNESHDEWGCANTVTERKTDQHSALQKAEQCTKYIMQSKLICKCALLLHSLLSLC